MADIVHRMGGAIRKDFSSNVTQLVANHAGGEKYRVSELLHIAHAGGSILTVSTLILTLGNKLNKC